MSNRKVLYLCQALNYRFLRVTPTLVCSSYAVQYRWTVYFNTHGMAAHRLSCNQQHTLYSTL